jgi:hypothetical protein
MREFNRLLLFMRIVSHERPTSKMAAGMAGGSGSKSAVVLYGTTNELARCTLGGYSGCVTIKFGLECPSTDSSFSLITCLANCLGSSSFYVLFPLPSVTVTSPLTFSRRSEPYVPWPVWSTLFLLIDFLRTLFLLTPRSGWLIYFGSA